MAKEHILAGDIFQVVLAQRFDLDLDADPFDVYRVLRQVNPSPYMYFVRQPGRHARRLVARADGAAARRHGDLPADRRHPPPGPHRRGGPPPRRPSCIEHPKELAEHVMLVDLARNDVGRVVEFGTEQVDEMMTLERYSHVMHLTSQVSGELRRRAQRRSTCCGPRCRPAPCRARRRCGPWRSSTSSSPPSAGPYAGVVGYLDFSGNIDTAIAIRTLVVGDDGRASVQAGAGIVADSVPEHEDLECHNKARALLAAVPAARRMTARRRAHAGGTPSPAG